MALVFLISGLIGIVLQLVLDIHSLNPVIGASGGISGLFAAALIMLHKLQGGLSNNQSTAHDRNCISNIYYLVCSVAQMETPLRGPHISVVFSVDL